MARWETGSRERLAEAALRLFGSRGFESTTVAEIAAEAGVTERTFFRYYSDKREVLFTGQEEFGALFLAGLDHADGTAPLDLIAASLGAVAAFFPEEKRAWSRARAVVLAANPPLQERESHKMATVVDALAEALAGRGIEPTAAALAAEAGVSVFRRSFATWIADGETRGFAEIQADTLAQLRTLLG